jgi:hypothetical protein
MDKTLGRILLIIAGVLLFLALTRMLWAFRVALVGAVVVIAGYLIYSLYMGLSDAQQAKKRANSLAGQIEGRLAYCREQLAESQQEIDRIQGHIREIQGYQSEDTALGEKNTEEQRQLLRGFQSELKLRHAKASFYRRCIQKLEHMLHNQEVAENLASKKEELRRLQEERYEDIADLEELKSTIEMDTMHLKTIDELSSRMLESNSLDHALSLKNELEQMTRDLDEL